MKKIFKVTNWDTSGFSSTNVADRSHWFVKAIDHCLALLEIGVYSIQYSTDTKVILNTENYGSIEIEHPLEYNSSKPCLFYVNSETKELYACCCFSGQGTLSRPHTLGTGSNAYNHLRTRVCRVASGSAKCKVYGPTLRLKFVDGTIKGTAKNFTLTVPYEISTPANCSGTFTLGVLGSKFGLHDRSNVVPTEPVSMEYEARAIISSNFEFSGERFESIYETKDYYNGPMVNQKGNLFYYDGTLFEVDNGFDIGIIETTIESST